jgi:hypothetical protein
MFIYKIPNAAELTTKYVCDSQATIDAKPANVDVNQCVIGGETEANTLLSVYQSDWLNKQGNLFTVDLQTSVEGGVKWEVIDLSTQLHNTDSQYFVFDPTTGNYTEAIGLDSAKTLFAQTQQIYLVFTDMNKYTTTNSWE